MSDANFPSAPVEGAASGSENPARHGNVSSAPEEAHWTLSLSPPLLPSYCWSNGVCSSDPQLQGWWLCIGCLVLRELLPPRVGCSDSQWAISWIIAVFLSSKCTLCGILGFYFSFRVSLVSVVRHNCNVSSAPLVYVILLITPPATEESRVEVVSATEHKCIN